jgi:hypothetical protein
MPQNGAQILSEVRVPVLSVVCEPCGRRERYDVERLMRQYGWDAKLTDLLPALVADCPERSSVKGVFEKLLTGLRQERQNLVVLHAIIPKRGQ